MSWTLTFSITLGHDRPDERDEDRIGTHHDAGLTVGFTRPEGDE